jgi:hypothetical protein
MADPDTEDVLAVCRLHMSEADAHELCDWLARACGRAVPMSLPDRDAEERLRRIVGGWLDPARRRRLLGWLERRAARGEPMVPGRGRRAA